MNKFIITILFLFLSLPVFAGNLLQQEDETAKTAEMVQESATDKQISQEVKKTNKFVKVLKDIFKTNNTKLEEINQTAITSAVEDMNIMGISRENIFYESADLEQYIKTQNDKINSLYALYKKNPNNIKNNIELVKLLASKGVEIKDFNDAIKNDILDRAYKVYLNTYQQELNKVFKFEISMMQNYNKSQNSYYQDLRYNFATHKYNFDSFISVLLQCPDNNYAKIYKNNEQLSQEWYNIAVEVSEYSYNYEKQKYVTWAQKNHKKMIANISLSSYVYQPYAPAPQSGYLYVYNPKMDFTLQAFQTVPGGVILTGSYYMVHTPEIDNIFLQTSKKYADGKYILEPIIAEYKGYYDYYTVLGVKKRIYKFYRLGESEIKKNFEIPGQPFYFYTPY